MVSITPRFLPVKRVNICELKKHTSLLKSAKDAKLSNFEKLYNLMMVKVIGGLDQDGILAS